ncbi:MAG: DUF2183 domain-containing protein [Chloroflexota bacterium]|nr:DUF2183 domain-containing protein [Chloroflexota bacterium]
MKRRSRRRRVLPVSMLVTTVALALSRIPVLEEMYRGRKAAQRKARTLLKDAPPKVAQLEEQVHEGLEAAGVPETLVAKVEKQLIRLANVADKYYDRVKTEVGARFGGDDHIRIMPYRGFGNPKKLFLKGRVLEDEGIPPATMDDSLWRNLVNVYKRFESDEVPGAKVLARFQGTEYVVLTGEEGFFNLWMDPVAPLPIDRLWHEVELELLSRSLEDQPPTRTTGYLLVPPPSARFGVISDVDDTVVMTNATNLLQMGRTVFFGNAHTRVPFAGVAAFYEALQAGSTGNEFNPLFYVSSSPWNLYDLLTEFLDIQDIPIGPLMLRDWGISDEEILPTKHAPHKQKSIRQILETFPDLPFILIGDSGQEDPEIYSDIVHQYPDRILAVYIRNVSQNPQRDAAIRELADEVAHAGSTLILTDDTLAAALHAAEQRWIAPEALTSIRAQVEADKSTRLPDTDEAPTIVVKGQE